MTAIDLGCSHTFGVGVDSSECYVSLLEKYYNTTIINTARPDRLGYLIQLDLTTCIILQHVMHNGLKD
jgi:hypothetical protein